MKSNWTDIKSYRNPTQLVLREVLLAVAFIVLVIMKPFLNSLVDSGMSPGMASLLVGIVGFVILWMMEKTWKQLGPVAEELEEPMKAKKQKKLKRR